MAIFTSIDTTKFQVISVITAKWIVPVNAKKQVLKQHALVIQADKIIDLLPLALAEKKYAHKAEWIDLGNQLLIPGLINLNTYCINNYALGENNHPPTDAQLLVSGDYQLQAELAIAEILRSGTTCFCDNYYFPEYITDTIRRTGIRAQLNTQVLMMNKRVWHDLDKARVLAETYVVDEQITSGFAPGAIEVLSDDCLIDMVKLAEKNNARIQLNLHESERAVNKHIKLHGNRPLRRLKKLGILGKHIQCVNMTILNDDDQADLTDSQVHVVHCPKANMYQALGVCPVSRLMSAKVNVTIASASAVNQNDVDLFSQMRTAMQLSNALTEQSELTPYELLAACSINAAKAMGVESQLGSLAPGKMADITAVDLTDLDDVCHSDPVSQLIYAATRYQVSNVWVGGKRLLDQGELTAIDKQGLHNKIALKAS